MREPAAVVLSLLLFAACADGPGPSEPSSPPAGALEVSVDSATLAAGEELAPEVSIVDDQGEGMDLSTIEWTSSDSSVVTVDSLGRMTALSPGSARIRAYASPLEHLIEIRVPDVRSIRLIPESDSLFVGERLRFRVELETDIPFAPSLERFAWSTYPALSGPLLEPGIVRAAATGGIEVSATLGGTVGLATVRIVDPGTPYLQVLGTSLSSCALREGGLAYCWGSSGLIGTPIVATAAGGYELLPLPHDPEGLRFDTLASTRAAYCGLRDGAVHCWGINVGGMFGPGLEARRTYLLPQPVATDLRFTAITLGSAHACGLDGNGRAYCWGSNGLGQLGDGTIIDRPEPAPVSGDLRFIQLAAGGNHTCGVTVENVVYCWGDDSVGSVRGGTTPCPASTEHGVCALEPVAAEGVPLLRQVASGVDATCGLTDQGALWCWGGPWDDPHRMDDQVYSTVAYGEDHGCALTTQSQPYCFGSNAFGKLANPGTGHGFATAPVSVYGSTRFRAIDTGLHHTCGVAVDGTDVYCWGLNQQGQLGLGHLDPANIPRKVRLP